MPYTIPTAIFLCATSGLLQYLTYKKCHDSYQNLVIHQMPDHAVEANGYSSLLSVVYLFFSGYMMLNIVSKLTSLQIHSWVQAMAFWVDTTSMQLFVLGVFFLGYIIVLFAIKSLLKHRNGSKEPW
jgi:hypothetical protein